MRNVDTLLASLPTDAQVTASLRTQVDQGRTMEQQTEVRVRQAAEEVLAPTGVANAVEALRDSMRNRW